MFSSEYGDWLTNQWWFWALIVLGSLAAGLLAGLLINWQTHRRRREQLRRDIEVATHDTLRQVGTFLAGKP